MQSCCQIHDDTSRMGTKTSVHYKSRLVEVVINIHKNIPKRFLIVYGSFCYFQWRFCLTLSFSLLSTRRMKKGAVFLICSLVARSSLNNLYPERRHCIWDKQITATSTISTIVPSTSRKVLYRSCLTRMPLFRKYDHHLNELNGDDPVSVRTFLWVEAEFV